MLPTTLSCFWSAVHSFQYNAVFRRSRDITPEINELVRALTLRRPREIAFQSSTRALSPVAIVRLSDSCLPQPPSKWIRSSLPRPLRRSSGKLLNPHRFKMRHYFTAFTTNINNKNYLNNNTTYRIHLP